MTYCASEALRAYFSGLALHGIKLGLDNIGRLLAEAGDPQRAYPTVHVAGTNGKGSVLAFLDAMLRAAGYRTGRFTSPHLLEVNERFLVDARPIGDEALDQAIAKFRNAAAVLDCPPTYFELCTAIAFEHFAGCGVDLGLIEVGMGGRLDSTNVLVPQVAAITNIALEHTAYLGDTLEKIAFEKAGILKSGVPAVVTETQPGPLGVILEHARRVGAPVRLPGKDFVYATDGTPWRPLLTFNAPDLHLEQVPLALAGRHQGANAAVAVAIAHELREAFPALDAAAVAHGLGRAHWPCRNERVLDSPPVFIDVAHNAAGARSAAELYRNCIVVVAISSDKDARRMLESFAPCAAELLLSTFEGGRALTPSEIEAAAGTLPHRTFYGMAEAIAAGLERASESRPLLITGSIFAAGEARRILIDRYGATPVSF